MPRPSSFDRVCCPSAMIACHAQLRPTVCAVQGLQWNSASDVVRPYIFSKVKIVCHARNRPTMYVFQGRWWYATFDVVRPCVLPKVDDGMSCPASSMCVAQMK